MQLTGLHHVSSISAHIGVSSAFFRNTLGMRPLIKTVNQDDPSMYHLFFGDGAGTPGSEMTVFDIPNAVREQRGNNSISLTTFRVAGARALDYWAQRLDEYSVPHLGVQTRDGRSVIDFDDPEGTQLSLIDDAGAGESFPWTDSIVPAEHQIRGLGHVVVTVPSLDRTAVFLTEGLGLHFDHAYDIGTGHQAHVFRVGAGGAHAEIHVRVRPDMRRAHYGAGGVHHLALRVRERAHMEQWVDRLHSLGYGNSGIVDRHYFTSIYVRDPNHVLFELATDGPGLDIDGPLDGDRLSLPPFLEARREQIEARLKPLDM